LEVPVWFDDDTKNPTPGEVILDPGGWETPPASPEAAAGAARSLLACIRIKEMLDQRGIKVFLTRSKAEVCSAEDRIRLVKQHPSATVLSIQPGNFESKEYRGPAGEVLEEKPGLSRSIVLAHMVLTHCGRTGGVRLPPVYYSRHPLLAAAAQNPGAVILHAGNLLTDETVFTTITNDAVAECLYLQEKKRPAPNNGTQIRQGAESLSGETAISKNGSGIASIELDGSPCVIRWSADHLEYPVPAAGYGIDSMKLSGAAAMQFLSKDSSEISRADRLSCSLQKGTLHVEGKFQIKSGGRLIKGANPESSADLSPNGFEVKGCSLQSIQP
jgi:hypothetical protein